MSALARLFGGRLVSRRSNAELKSTQASCKNIIFKSPWRRFSTSKEDIGENGTRSKSIWELAKEEEEEEKQRGIHRATTDDDESKISAEAKQLNEQGQLYFSNGLWEEALECFSTALQALEEVLGADHVECSTLNVNIGLVYEKSGDQTNAEMHYQKALNIRRKVLGENHVSVASVLHKLASALISKGDYDDALAILQQSQDILSQTLHVEKQVLTRAKDERTIAECHQRISMLDAELGQMFNFRGAIHWKRQNWSNAEENFLSSYQHFAKSSEFQQGLIDDITAVTRNAVAAMKKQGKMDQAIKVVTESVKVIETRSDAALPELINLLCLLGELHEMMGAYDLAEFHYGKAMHLARDVFGKVSDEVDDLEHSLKHVRRLKREEDEYRRK